MKKARWDVSPRTLNRRIHIRNQCERDPRHLFINSYHSSPLVGDDALFLGSLLEQLPTWTSVDLDARDIGDVDVEAIARSLEHSPLVRLSFRSNKIGPEGVETIIRHTRHIKTFAILDLGWNDIGVRGAMRIGEHLCLNKTLEDLQIPHTNIYSDGAYAIGIAIRSNRTLKSLDISLNNIDDEGAVAIGGALAHNSSLEIVNLDDNKIGSEGARALAEGLRHNRTLRVLSVNNNNVGDEGAAFLGEALRHNKTLQSLSIHKSCVGDEGARAFVEGLAYNNTLRVLRLDHNNISHRVCLDLITATFHHRSVTDLIVFGRRTPQSDVYNILKEKNVQQVVPHLMQFVKIQDLCKIVANYYVDMKDDVFYSPFKWGVM